MSLNNEIRYLEKQLEETKAFVHQLKRAVHDLAQKQAVAEETSAQLREQLEGRQEDHAKGIGYLKKQLEETKAAQIETSQNQHRKSRDYTKSIVEDTVADAMDRPFGREASTSSLTHHHP